jgi:UDP-N-acetyl-D-galactosamine dehydrogenase
MRTISELKLAIIGLGYVGLPLAVEFSKHRPVVGFDINKDRIAALQEGREGAEIFDRNRRHRRL